MSDEPLDLEALNEAFASYVPHNAALGLKLIEAKRDPAVAVIRLPWSEQLVGNPETGVLHGGAITTLLDATSGASVFFKLREPIPIATLDLRVDYLKPATPRADVFARVECFKTTHNIAFVRGVAYQADPEDPIATATGTFMLQTKGRSVAERGL